MQNSEERKIEWPTKKDEDEEQRQAQVDLKSDTLRGLERGENAGGKS